jgi:very-short-patch-repair endonuclease
MSGATTAAGSGGQARDDVAAHLNAAADSDLERRLVAFLGEKGLRLPDRAQVHVVGASARPDFVFDLPSGPVAVFVDGPVHDHATQATRDAAAEDRLIDEGWDVVRFRYDADWTAVVAARPGVFGVPSDGNSHPANGPQ